MISSYGRILSVDSEPKYRKMITAYLEDSGFTLYEANDGDEALSIFRESKPDLVISGIKMPVADGSQLLEVIKKESPETPIIAIYNMDTASDILHALRLGAWDCVVKPINDLTVLEHAVCRALERGRLVTENKNYSLELEKKNTQLTMSLTQLKEDQKAGTRVQEKLLPLTPVQFKDYVLSQKILPSLYLSGDFVDYFQIDKNRVGFYIADVSGHGASSAFVTVLLKSIVEKMLLNYQLDRDEIILHPDKLLNEISNAIFHANLSKYLTMIYGVLDISKNSLTYSVGGHYPNPILWDGKMAVFLEGMGFAVGIIKNAKYKTYTKELPREFAIAMFSDGILEIMEGKNLEENEKILLDLFNHTGKSIEEIFKYLNVKSEAGYPDDISLLLINRSKLCKPIK